MKRILALVLSLAIAASQAGEVDKRQILSLNELQRDHILAEMRALLSGTQRILAALAEEDMTAVAAHARSLGMGMAHKGEDHLQRVLPKAFMQLGLSVHQSFDRIAVEAESRRDARYTLRQLSESMKACAACHDNYQIRVTETEANPALRPPHH